MKLKFKKYLSTFILCVPIPLWGLNPPDTIRICNSVNFPPTTTYKEPKNGSIIAKRLNKRFNTIVSECEYNNPAYVCSGIILRAIPPDRTEFWKEGESYSYFRADLETYKLHRYKPTAYVINGLSRYRNPFGRQAYVKCAYPIDGVTRTRPSRDVYQRGCTKSTDFPDIPGECSKRGITTLEQWKKDFNKVTTQQGVKRYSHQCSFDAGRVTGTKEFALSLEARRSLNLYNEDNSVIQNEIVIKSWSDTDYKPQDIPVEAILYTNYNIKANYPIDTHPLRYAQAMQCAYVKATIDNADPGKRIKYPIPIIYLDLERLIAKDYGNVFKYKERDQVVRFYPKSKLTPILYFLKVI
ncbi:hypothetical protein ID856_02505 [Xenorhabdus sp. 18]|uniref:hypothetical protein n=1 Tax=Xenorhabdus doucetiae TaxID=351671 RepID=UPI0019CCCA71|nr:hypothetical protein [Xenorhabdus sp. 18]MBD2795412.1 hypothetical protein [Xenorhabdus sp. 18]